MNFSDYTDSGVISIGTSSYVTVHYGITLSDGNYVFLDHDGTQVRLRKMTPETNTALQTVYVRNADDSADLAPDTGHWFVESYRMVAQPGTDKFIVVAPESGGNMVFNVWNNDFTLDRTFEISDPAKRYGSLRARSDGRFAYFGAENDTGNPKLYYFNATGTGPRWTQEIDTGEEGAGDQELSPRMVFLSNGNLALASYQTTSGGGDGQVWHSIWNPDTETRIIGPIVDPVGEDVNAALELASYTDYYIIFWETDNGRYAARYLNNGTLQTQSSYNIGFGDILGIGDSTTWETDQGAVSLVVWTKDEVNFSLVLRLFNLAEADADGIPQDDLEIAIPGVEVYYPFVTPLPNDQGWMMVYADSDNNTYYRTWKLPDSVDPNQTWGWWWKSPLRPKMKPYGVTTMYPWGSRRQ